MTFGYIEGEMGEIEEGRKKEGRKERRKK